ncbi:hypothetical protein RFI_34906, partial [Reticulomyxa filosa]
TWKWGTLWQRIARTDSTGNVANGSEKDKRKGTVVEDEERAMQDKLLSLPSMSVSEMDRGNAKKEDVTDESNWSTKYSIAELPPKDAERISSMLMQFKTKKQLQLEVEKAIKKLQELLQHHAQQIMESENNIRQLRDQIAIDTHKWKLWHIIDLQIIAQL